MPRASRLVVRLGSRLIQVRRVPTRRLGRGLTGPFLKLRAFNRLTRFTLFRRTGRLKRVRTVRQIVRRANMGGWGEGSRFGFDLGGCRKYPLVLQATPLNILSCLGLISHPRGVYV